MKFGPVPIENAEGKILAHHIPAVNGHPALRKGKPLRAGDILALQELGHKVVLVAELEPGDLDEDTAAGRAALAVCGANLFLSKPNVGRVNLQAECLGILDVDTQRLRAFNEVEGITLATLFSHSVARPRQTVATVKVIPFAIAGQSVCLAESIGAAQGPLLNLHPILPQRVSVILCGSLASRQRVLETFEPPLRTRIEGLDSQVASLEYIPLEQNDLGESALMESLRRTVEKGAQLIVMAGETAIMDARDIQPRAVEGLGGVVASFGAPVDPGNLMMVAYLGDIPVLGAPGCARSLKPNVIDWVLPRLLSGERIKQADIQALGHGGLLGGLPEGMTWREALSNE